MQSLPRLIMVVFTLCLLCLLAATAAVRVAAAPAVTLVVDTLDDIDNANYSAGDFSLREAIVTANAGDMINFDPSLSGGTITLNGSPLVIDKNLTISATVPITISGDDSSRILDITVPPRAPSAAPVVTLHGLTLRDGLAPSGQYGGAIRADVSGTQLTISASTIVSNTAARGGGLHTSSATVTIEDSTLSYNTATHGGAHYIAAGNVTIRRSTLAHNTVIQNGGALRPNLIATLTVENSTLHDNTASSGGAIALGGTLNLRNSTLADNLATFSGGAIYMFGDSTANLVHSTLSGNSATGGVIIDYISTAILNLTANIIANSTASGGNCSSFPPATDINNLVEGGGCGTPVSTDDPNLGALADNGGPTQTMALPDNSPAVDLASRNGCALTSDQRGISRPQGGACDIGAFELEQSNAIELAAFDGAALPGGGVRLTWQTASEIDSAGFNLLRGTAADGSDRQAVNGALIAATGANGLGASYLYDDTTAAPGTWYYWLEEIDAHGRSTLHGPVVVTSGGPTAVALRGLGTSATGALWGVLALIVTTLVVSLRARRNDFSRFLARSS